MRKLSTTVCFVMMVGFCAAVLNTAFLASAAWAGGADKPVELMNMFAKVATLQQAGKFEEALPLAKKAIELSAQLNGRENTVTANSIGTLGDIYKGKNQYAKAEEQYKRALAILEKAEASQRARFLPAQLYNLGKVYVETNRYAEALPLLQRAVAINEKAEDSSQLGIYLDELAKIHFHLSEYAKAETEFLRAQAALEKAFGKEHFILAPVANNLASVYQAQGRYKEAETMSRQAIAVFEKQFGAENAQLGPLLSNLADILRAEGLYREAETMLKRSLSIIEKAYGADSTQEIYPVSNLGTLYHYQRRDDEAEPLLRRALTIAQKTKGANSREVAAALNNFATFYSDKELYDDAEPFLKRSLAIREKILGRHHPDTALALNNLAVLYRDQKRYAKAEPLLKRALATMEETYGKEHPNVALALNNLAMTYQDQGHNEKAEKLLKRALGIRKATLGPEHPAVGETLHNLAGLYHAMNRVAEAQKLYEQSLAIIKKTLGENHTLVSTSLNNQAELKYKQQKWVEAAKLWEGSIDLLIQRRLRRMVDEDAVETEKARVELNNENSRFWRLVKVSYRAAASPVQMLETAAKMFKIAQWAQNSQAAHSIALMAARQVKGDGPLTKLMRERQDLVSEWQALDKNVLLAATREEDKRSPEAEKEANERMTAIDVRLKEIDAEVAEDHPEYASLANPDALSVEDVQGILNSNEALVFFLDTPEKAPLPGETFVWVVTPTKMLWVSADIGRAELQREVSALRCGLDAEIWAKGGDCAKILGVEYSHDDYLKGRPLPFDVSRAHALYKLLFSKIEDQIKDKKLLIVASGALTQLPFQVLVTKKPQTAFPDTEGMRKAPWLIRDNALTVLPAVSSLKALRRFAKASTGEKTYLGVGNPLLDGKNQRYAPLAKQAREKQSCGGAPAKQPAANQPRLSRSVDPLAITGSVANVDHIRMQSPLPETADELCAVARDLKAGENDVLLGGKATEANLKALSAQGTLAQYRVLHFATHGLLAGQITTDAEPGLILTPPAKASPEDDGYLSASEILTLKLNADWVILSACNTAGAKAHSAEALSGMARAFFYAGARSVVVSHWSVRSEPTVKLVTAALEAMTADSSVTPAEAMRRAMLKLIDEGTQEEAHPEYWAPFVLVGEGSGA